MNTKVSDNRKPWLAAGIALIVCTLVRLVPFRAPNVEPVFATTMPFARKYGVFLGFAFGASNIVLYDLVTAGIGSWTFISALAYGIVGAGAAYALPKFKKRLVGYVSYAVIGTIIYDALTGLTLGPIAFHQPIMSALVGQIPFTALHLLGNIAFALTISPAVDFALGKLAVPSFSNSSLKAVKLES
jgi:hypothetical protein